MKNRAVNPAIGLASMIKILFFAQLADYAQTDSIQLNYRAGASTRDLLTAMEQRLPKELLECLRHDANMLSINQVLAAWDDPLTDGDEIAFLPPFSGG